MIRLTKKKKMDRPRVVFIEISWHTVLQKKETTLTFLKISEIKLNKKEITMMTKINVTHLYDKSSI